MSASPGLVVTASAARQFPTTSDGLPRLLASVRDGRVGLRRGRLRDPGHGRRSARPRPGGVRHLRHRARGGRLLPGAPRPDGGGAADEVRIPLHRRARSGGSSAGSSSERSRSSSPAESWRRSRWCSSPRLRTRSSAPRGLRFRFSWARSCPSCRRRRTWARRRSCSEGATTCGARIRRSPWPCASIAIVIAAPHGVTETLAAMVVAQAIATVAISVVGLAAFRRFPAAPARPLGDGSARGHLLHPRLERRHRCRLAADDARAARPRHRRGPDAGRSLPHRPDTADGPLGGQLTRAPRPPHRPDAGLGARQADERARRSACLHAGRRRPHGRRRPRVPARDAVARGDDLRQRVLGRGGRGPHHPGRGRDPVRARLVEVAAGDDRASPPADRDPRSGGAGRHPAGRAARVGTGRDGSGSRGARRDGRVRALPGGWRSRACGWMSPRADPRTAWSRREGPDRLRDLATRRRWACESRSRARRLPARARALRRGRDDCRRPAREAAIRGSLGGSSSSCGGATCACRGLDSRTGDPRRRRVRDEHAGPSGRSVRRSPADRSWSSSSRTRPTSARGAGGCSRATSTTSSASAAGFAFGRCDWRAIARFAASPTSSARAGTWRRSR